MGKAEGYKRDDGSGRKVIVTSVEALAPVYTPFELYKNMTLRFLWGYN